MRGDGAVLCPEWYAEMLGEPTVSIEAALDEAFGRRLVAAARRSGALRGLLIAALARRSGQVALTHKEPGTLPALAVIACLPRRMRPRADLLHVLPRQAPKAAWRRRLWRIRFRLIERPVVRGAISHGQVLTEREGPAYAALYGLDRSRLLHIPWAFSRTGVAPPPFDPDLRGVVASGRASCDWPTLFAAAAGSTWPLTVICGRDDLAEVTTLNDDGRAAVHCELSRPEHDEIVAAAAVYVLPLRADGPGAGHLRLMAACDAGTPVVASNVPGLEGYAVDGGNVLAVPAAEPDALRSAIESLLADPGARSRLRASAAERGRSRTYSDYMKEIRAWLSRTE